MPLYEYQCKKCNKEFSVTLSLSEYGQKKVKCPKCDSTEVVRLLSVVSLRTSKKS